MVITASQRAIWSRSATVARVATSSSVKAAWFQVPVLRSPGVAPGKYGAETFCQTVEKFTTSDQSLRPLWFCLLQPE